MARLSPSAAVVESLLYDLRYAARTLIRTPGWTSMALLTLALGTGANAAVFSFVDALLFKSAPGIRPQRPLVAVYTSDFSSGPYGGSSYPDYLSFKSDTTAFATLTAIDDSEQMTLRAGDDLQRVRVGRVTAEYFEALGVRTSNGRPIIAADTEPSAPPAAVIGDALWRRAFASEPAAVGSTMMLNGKAFTIVGVAPPRFTGIDAGRPIEVWTPLNPAGEGGRGDRGLVVLGQLRDGVSLPEARAQLAALAGQLAREYPASNLGTLERPKEPRPFAVIPVTRIDPEQRAQVAMVATVLMGGVGLVLLLACANVASLLLSRTTTRAREIAVRRALGATGPRLMRQLLTETAVLAFASTALAMIFAAWTADVLPSFFPAEQAAALDVSPGLRVWTFALALSGISAVLVGVLPALRAVRPPLAASLRGAAGDITERTASRSRTVLVVAQVAIACVLLVTAALLAQSVSNQLHADFGFTTRRALLATVDVPARARRRAGTRVLRPGAGARRGAARRRRRRVGPDAAVRGRPAGAASGPTATSSARVKISSCTTTSSVPTTSRRSASPSSADAASHSADLGGKDTVRPGGHRQRDPGEAVLRRARGRPRHRSTAPATRWRSSAWCGPGSSGPSPKTRRRSSITRSGSSIHRACR